MQNNVPYPLIHNPWELGFIYSFILAVLIFEAYLATRWITRFVRYLRREFGSRD